MKAIRFEYDEANGIEGAFDEDDNIIAGWDDNDATWRSEYFGGILAFLDCKEIPSTSHGRNGRIKKLRDYLGL